MDEWKNFNYRNLWQHPMWAAFQEAIGRKVWTIKEGGGYAVVVKHDLPFGLCWLEVPRGPLFENAGAFKKIMEAIEKLGKKEQVVFIRYSSFQEIKGDVFKPTKYDHQPETSLVIDLEQSEDEILEQMKPKGRYNIKVALKHDVEVEVSEDVDTFYYLLKTTANRDGFGLHEKAYYEKMLKELGDKAQLLMARYQDRVIAGGIFVYLDEWGIYYYGASENQYRKTMATYLVQWEAMKEAKKRGCKYYDFLGIAPEGAKNHPWAGVTKFKSKFGGRVVSYPKAKDLVLRPYWYFAYKMSKIFR